MMSLRFRLVLPLLVFAVAVAATQSDVRPPRTTYDSVYSSPQATRGKDKFALVCLSCHDMDEHKAILREVWIGKPLAEFFNYLVTEMPSGDPGTLSPQEYSDVTAYILQLNGMPAGEVELPTVSDSLAAIVVDTIASATDSTGVAKDTIATDTLPTDTMATDTIVPDTSAIRSRPASRVPSWLLN